MPTSRGCPTSCSLDFPAVAAFLLGLSEHDVFFSPGNRSCRKWILGLTLALFVIAAGTADAQRIPFILPWNDSTPSVTDFSSLNPPITTNRVAADTNGHFVVEG